VGRTRPPVDGAVYVGEVEVVAEQVDALAGRLEEVEGVFEDNVDEVVQALADAVSQGLVARLECHMACEAFDVREDAQVGDGERRVAFELGIAECEESERGGRSDHSRRFGAVVCAREQRPVELGRLEEGGAPGVGSRGIVGRRQRECAAAEDREEVEVDGQGY